MTLALTAARSFIAGAPQVLLTATATSGSPNPLGSNVPLTVTRIHADGSRWAVITDADPAIIGGGWVWLDTHAPYNAAIRYELTAGGVTVTSGTTFSPSTKAWLLSPVQANLGFEIHGIKEIAERNTASRSARFQPIGSEAVFLSDGRRNGIVGSLTLRVPVAKETALRSLLAGDTMVLINTPGTVGWDIGWLWVQPTAVSYSNPSNLVPHPYRTVTIGFEQGAQPFADLVPTWNSGTAAAYFAARAITSAGVVALYTNSANFSINSRI